jgi:hypothetical protein
LVVGKKGSGKSALVREVTKKWYVESKPAILLRPKDIAVVGLQGDSLGDLTSSAETALIKAISIKVGELANGFLDAELALLDAEARQQGDKSPDFIQRIGALLSPVAKLLGHGDGAFSQTELAPNKARFKSAINSLLAQQNSEVLLVIDDTDQVARVGGKSDLDRIWALILACRSIQEECPGVRCIVVLRSEVWRRLENEDTAHRDQVDHFRNSIYELSPRSEDVREILMTRLRTVVEEARGSASIHPFDVFFERRDVLIPTSPNERRTWDDFIVARSRKRPRDAIQLVSLLARHARDRFKKDRSKIGDRDLDTIIRKYSEERVDDLQIEYGVEFPKLKDVLRKFAHANFDESGFTFTAQSARRFLGSLPTQMAIILHGVALKTDNSDDVFKLWSFLYQCGFLNSRISSASQLKKFDHIREEEDPTFVTSARWPEMQASLWEVNPAYRDFLLGVQSNSPIGRGLPRKGRSEKRGR